ncbi:MAG: hypothetical protein WDW36_002571 [Sanguina aurantia]
MLKKTFWQQIFTTTPTTGREKYSAVELRNLYDVLQRNALVTDANRALVVETIRSVAEFIIWGDQNEPKVFDFFLENNIMLYLHTVLLQSPANRSGEVAKQVLQTLSIIIQNVRSETGIFFLFSNNHINNIVEVRFDFEDEEVLGYYISFLKTISLKLNKRTVQFFFDLKAGMTTFPLYSEACKFAHHKEGMVRAGVRTLTLNVYSVDDPYIQQYITSPGAASYFHELCGYVAEQIRILDRRMAAAQGFTPQALSSLDSQIAEVEDMLSYISDILATGSPTMARLVSQHLWGLLAGPYWLQPLLGYDPVCRAAADETGGPAAAAPAHPQAPAQAPAPHSTQPRQGRGSEVGKASRAGARPLPQTLTGLVEAADHRTASAALRLLVAIMQNKSISPEVLQAVHLLPSARLPDLRSCCLQGACMACSLQDSLPAGSGLLDSSSSNSRGGSGVTTTAVAAAVSDSGASVSGRVPDGGGIPAFACGRVFPYLTVWDQQSKARAAPAVACTPTGRAPAASPHTPSQTASPRVSSAQPSEPEARDTPSVTDVALTDLQLGGEGSSELSPHMPPPPPPPAAQLDGIEEPTHLQTCPEPSSQRAPHISERPQHLTAQTPPAVTRPMGHNLPLLLLMMMMLLLLVPRSLLAQRKSPNPRYFIGTGKADEVGEAARAVNADVILIDHVLTPVQERNLEEHLGIRVIDRSGLILDIFAQRARSHEGKLEVELAQLKHFATRLVGGWTHLDAQRGGAIGNRGPGETQLELDRRLLADRVQKLTKRLEKVQTQRTQQRRARLRNTVPRVALVGYTNAGKSTLFNALTTGGVYAADQLFATLDPTVRKLEDLSCGPAVLADTVGFIRELPHDLVAAFRATLAEARDADLLLHVCDAADEERDRLYQVVDKVLDEIDAGDLPQLQIMNKIDLAGTSARIDRNSAGKPQRVWLSSVTGEGIDLLRQALGELLGGDRIQSELQLPLSAGRLHSRLRAAGAITGETVDEHGWALTIDAPRSVIAPLSGGNAAETLLLRDLSRFMEEVHGATAHVTRLLRPAGVSTQRPELGLSNSAICALHTYRHVQQLVALLQLHALLSGGATSREAPLPSHQGWEQRPDDIMEKQHVELQSGSAIPCVVSFAPGQEKRVYFAAGGVALSHSASQALAGGDSRSVRSTVGTAALLHSSPAVVLADPAPTRMNTGIVLSVAPLLGADPALDRSMGKWLHVHVRPSVRGLLKILQPGPGRLARLDLMAPMRQLADGHWVLAFPDSERAMSARSMVELHSHKLRAVYVELLQPLMDVSFE